MDSTFEIGFVLAGAISAGAYTAGVMDFITEAIDAYEQARTTGRTPDGEPWDGPTHQVRVPVLAGASAGGMTAAITALSWFTDLTHVGPGDPPRSEANRLYASWVDEIDIEPLLASGGLEQGVLSILNCAVLDQIVDRTLMAQRTRRSRAWLGRGGSTDLALIMTASNLRGVPYSFKLFGEDTDEAYGMLNHGDAMRFMLGTPASPRPGYVSLNTDDLPLASPPVGGAWQTLHASALATGSFPVALQARRLARPFQDYIATPPVDYVNETGEITGLPPQVPVPPATYDFVAVDGGVINNEPFELARRYLAQGLAQNDRNAATASRAMVLVDPFPNHARLPDAPGPDALKLISILPQFLGTVIDQARFKPEELALAQNERVFSRFAIVPSRPNADNTAPKYPIACGILGGFGGFLHKSFRRHDYLLGRRNAQAFLRWSFVLGESNPLFARFVAERGDNASKWYVRETPGGTGSVGPGADATPPAKVFRRVESDETENAFPIVPLTPRMLQPIEIPAADLPDPDAVDVDGLEDRIGSRLAEVTGRLLRSDLEDIVHLGPLMKPASYLAQEYLAHIAKRMAAAKIKAGLDDLRQCFR